MKKIGVSLLLAVVLALGLASAALAGDENEKAEFEADLVSLNGSGASGEAELKLENGMLEAEIESEGLEPNLPHLQHIHGKNQAASECPTLTADVDGDELVSVREGAPFYGPVLVSFTATGDTSAASGGAPWTASRSPMLKENWSTRGRVAFRPLWPRGSEISPSYSTVWI